MNYIQWNEALAKRYFCNVKAAQTFLCITIDTLKDVAGLPSEDQALKSFIKAVKEGPYWTRNVTGEDHLPGCRTILSKAHNCLHPNPDWKNQPARANEKLDLSDHVDWREWEDESLQYPPYLAYLLLFVLAWTERNDNDHGLEFYDPLNRILGLEGDDCIRALGRKYNFGNRKLTINDLWSDLCNWSLEVDVPVIDLPPLDDCTSDYLSIPKHYGLIKASDLRQLDRVFFELSENHQISARINPDQLVNNIINSSSVFRLFSDEGRQCLRDSTRQSALGRLLFSKYMAWDGCIDESYIGATRSSHKLLRVLKNAKIQSLIKLRSVKAMERAIIEEGVSYKVETDNPNAMANLYTIWPLKSEFSAIFQIESDDHPLNPLSVNIPELGIKALRDSSENRPLVLAKQALVHLLDAHVEVDEVEVGKHYLLLTKAENDNYAIQQFLSPNCAVRKPPGYQAFTLRVPESVNPESWPVDYLPPLAKQREGSKPRIKVESVFAIGRDSYLAGFPITITSTSDDYSIIINPDNVPHQTCHNTIVATPSISGELALSLCLTGANQPPEANKKISIYEHCPERVDSTEWVSFQFYPNLPIYPRGEIILNDKSLLFSKDENMYFLSGKLIEISHSGENGKYKFLLKIDNSVIEQKRHCLTGDNVKERGSVDLKLLANGDIIDKKKIIFLPNPSLQISGLSLDKQHPALLNRRCFGAVQFSKIENPALNSVMISLEFLGRKKSISLPVLNINWLDFLTEGGRENLPSERVFELQFFLGNIHLSSCWVKSPRHFSPAHSRPVVGRNNLGAIFDGILGKNS